jgi:hypothetical protein
VKVRLKPFVNLNDFGFQYGTDELVAGAVYNAEQFRDMIRIGNMCYAFHIFDIIDIPASYRVHDKSPFSWYRQKTTHTTRQRAQALALNERAGFRRILPHWPFGLPHTGSIVR